MQAEMYSILLWFVNKLKLDLSNFFRELELKLNNIQTFIVLKLYLTQLTCNYVCNERLSVTMTSRVKELDNTKENKNFLNKYRLKIQDLSTQ